MFSHLMITMSNIYEKLQTKSRNRAVKMSILSNEGRTIFEILNFVVICGLFGLFGIISNIINIIIFCKQGFANTSNIAFFGLAISDLCCLVSLEWISITMNPYFATSGLAWVLPDVMYLTGAWPHACFCRITSYITVYLTAERYISISLPLKVKEMITPKRTTLIVCSIYLVNLGTLIPEYTTSFLGWRFVPEKNTTLVALIFTTSRSQVEGLCYVLHSIFSTTSFFGVLIFTVILVNTLRRSSEWRKEATSNSSQKVTTSTRDKRTIKMVVLIATILIICYTPGAAVAMATFAVGPEFSIKGRYINTCVAAWSIAYVFQTFNSSVNIFLYYNMSSKYKHTFDNFFLVSVRKNFRKKSSAIN